MKKYIVLLLLAFICTDAVAMKRDRNPLEEDDFSDEETEETFERPKKRRKIDVDVDPDEEEEGEDDGNISPHPRFGMRGLPQYNSMKNQYADKKPVPQVIDKDTEDEEENAMQDEGEEKKKASSYESINVFSKHFQDLKNGKELVEQITNAKLPVNLAFKKCTNLTEKVLRLLLKKCPQIAGLTFSGEEAIKPLELAFLAAKNKGLFKQITKLYFDHKFNMSLTDLITIIKNTPNLTSLGLPNNTFINDDFVAELIMPIAKTLKALYFSNRNTITDKSLYLVAKHCPNLTAINFSTQNKFHNHAILSVIKNCKKLSHLGFGRGCSINDNVIQEIVANPPKIEILRCLSQPITDRSLVLLGKYASRLRLLTITCNKYITDNGIQALTHLVQSWRYRRQDRGQNIYPDHQRFLAYPIHQLALPEQRCFLCSCHL